jgi:hypothetical protein
MFNDALSSRDPNKYVRKSGFGYTKNNRNYSSRYTYSDSNPTDSFRISDLKQENDRGFEPKSSTRSTYRRTYTRTKPKNYVVEEKNYKTTMGERNFVKKARLTEEEYELFKNFGSPTKLKRNILS